MFFPRHTQLLSQPLSPILTENLLKNSGNVVTDLKFENTRVVLNFASFVFEGPGGGVTMMDPVVQERWVVEFEQKRGHPGAAL
jgi:hypothetical protein